MIMPFPILNGCTYLILLPYNFCISVSRGILDQCVSLFLTHWGRMTHICVGNLTIIGPDNGLSPGRRQAIIWTNAGILLIGPWGTNFNEILIGIHTFSFKKIYLKMSSAKWRPFCLGLNVLIPCCKMAPGHLLTLYSPKINSLAPGRCGRKFRSMNFISW